MNYLVRWIVEVTADSPEQAAREALSIQRDPKSLNLDFDVAEEADEAFLESEMINLEEERPVKFPKSEEEALLMLTLAGNYLGMPVDRCGELSALAKSADEKKGLNHA